MNPSSYRPQTFADLIGHAALLGQRLSAKLARLDPRTDTLRLLFSGAPGIGKSALARLIAETLAGKEHARFAVQRFSGPDVTVETIADLNAARCLSSLWGEWRIVVFEEVDKMSHAAKVRALDWLDHLYPGTAIIGTTNKADEAIEERFQSRFQVFPVKCPATDDINALLAQVAPEVPLCTRNQIAVFCGGNVRAALLDCETALDTQLCLA